MAADPLEITRSKESAKKPAAAESPQAAAAGREAPLNRLNRVQAMAEIVIAALVVLTACYVAKLVLVVLLVAILLAFIFAPLVDLLERIRLPRSVGAVIAVLVLLAAVGGVTYVSGNKATDFIQELPRYSGKIRATVGKMRQRTQKIEQATSQITGSKPKPEQQSSGLNWSSLISENVGSVTEVVVAASFIPFLLYFMLSWQEHARTATVKLFRMENRSTAYATLGAISTMIRSYIVGNVLVGLFMSATSMVVFAFLKVPYFYFIGVISGFVNLVPYLGVLLAPIAPLVAGAGRIRSTQAIIIVGVEVLLHLFSLNVLYPKFVGSRLQLNPLAVTIALLFWGWLWGAMGLILAIPITAATKIIMDHVESLRPFGEWLGE